jgi:hypothetical protein
VRKEGSAVGSVLQWNGGAATMAQFATGEREVASDE